MTRKNTGIRDKGKGRSLIISPFDINGDNLALVFSNEYTPMKVIRAKSHFKYLQNYLGDADNGLGIKTMVIEDKYISRDFLDDYTGYFARCYEPYDKMCKRVHFFNKAFTQDDFDNIGEINKHNIQKLVGQYRGCIVVKRIPYSVIGNTLLDVYPDNGEYRKILFGIKKYVVNLFGINFTINSLAYQEQDSVVSACATTAIWNVLSKAADNPRTLLKSPIEITASAGTVDAANGRMFPNKNGLSIAQMINALYEANLVTEHKIGQKQNDDEQEIKSGPFSNHYLKELIHAYAPIGIPQILILKTYEKEDVCPDLETEINRKEKSKPADGLHAVTLVGYKEEPENKKEKKNKLSEYTAIGHEGIKKYLKSRKIQRLYCHDDQHGPFMKCNLIGEQYFTSCWDEYEPEIAEPERLSNNQLADIIDTRMVYAEIRDIIIPLYPKIRISYDDFIQQHGQVLIQAIQVILSLISSATRKKDIYVDWDIQLVYSTVYKEDLLETTVSDKKKKAVISGNLPKYIWRARLDINEKSTMDFIFDATDVHNGNYFLDAICYNPSGVNYAKSIVKTIKGNPKNFSLLFKDVYDPRYSIQNYIKRLIEKLNENEM